MKNGILSQVLSQEARARREYFLKCEGDLAILTSILLSVNTIMVAKPEKGRQVEAAIIQMAQTGQISRLNEDELVGLLERFAGSTQKTAVKFDRRRNALDSDSD